MVAERLRARLEAQDLTALVPGLVHKLSCSVGVCTYPQHGDSYIALDTAVSAAHGLAKKLGGNRVAVGELAQKAPPKRPEPSASVVSSRQNLGWELDAPLPTSADGAVMDLVFAEERDFLRCFATDIPGGGLRIVLPRPVQLESTIELDLFFDQSKFAHRVSARVCWLGTDGRVGLQFVAVPRELAETLDRMVWRNMDPLQHI